MKGSVMIVDDDPGVRENVAMIVAHCGYEVVQAADGHACLAALRAGFHGVILMDVMMPGLTGWQTIREIITENLLNQNLICMLTGIPQPGSDSEGLEEWVFDYLPKPCTHEELLTVVETAMGAMTP